MKIGIFTTKFTPLGENCSFHYKYTLCGENSSFHYKFTPHGENFHHVMKIFTTNLHHVVKIFTTYLHHMVKIFTTKFSPHVVKMAVFTTFTLCGENFHYKIYTTCGENSNIYTTCSEKLSHFHHIIYTTCGENYTVKSQNRSYLSDVWSTTEDISGCGENYHTMPSGVKKILYDTNAASSVLFFF